MREINFRISGLEIRLLLKFRMDFARKPEPIIVRIKMTIAAKILGRNSRKLASQF
jgi:hypothetical protein